MHRSNQKIILPFFFLLCFAGKNSAQENVKTTESLRIYGAVKTPFFIQLSDLKKLPTILLDSFVIRNHAGEKKYTIHQVKGVQLKEVLKELQPDDPSPRSWSAYYFVCSACDGYTVVFSWNEIFNSANGNGIFIVLEKDGKPESESTDRILLLSAQDMNTGRRYVKGLQMIKVVKAVADGNSQ